MQGSLRDYGHKTIFKRDGFKCRYCGADGTKSFDTWLTLSVDHLLPVGHPDRENDDYKVTACNFCNTADNRYFERVKETIIGLPSQELFERRKIEVLRVRREYQEFWIKEVVLSQTNPLSEA